MLQCRASPGMCVHGVCLCVCAWTCDRIDFAEAFLSVCVCVHRRGLTGTVLCVSVYWHVYTLDIHVPCVCDWQSSLYFADVYSYRKSNVTYCKIKCNLSSFALADLPRSSRPFSRGRLEREGVFPLTRLFVWKDYRASRPGTGLRTQRDATEPQLNSDLLKSTQKTYENDCRGKNCKPTNKTTKGSSWNWNTHTHE